MTQDRRPRFHVNQLFTIPGYNNQELIAKFVEIFNLFTYNKIVDSSYFLIRQEAPHISSDSIFYVTEDDGGEGLRTYFYGIL